MLVPKRHNFDLFDDFFNDGFFREVPVHKKDRNFMKTDIKERKDKYILDIDLPGFDKKNIDLSLDNGYLNIHAKTIKEEKNNDDEKFIHQERYFGECSRSFYIGDDVQEEEINAEFKNGILKIEIPKKELTNKSNELKQIPIK